MLEQLLKKYLGPTITEILIKQGLSYFLKLSIPLTLLIFTLIFFPELFQSCWNLPKSGAIKF